MDSKSLQALEFHKVVAFLHHFACLESTCTKPVLMLSEEELSNHFLRLAGLGEVLGDQPLKLGGCLGDEARADLVARKGALPRQESLWDLLAHLRQYQQARLRILKIGDELSPLRAWLPPLEDLGDLLERFEQVFDERGQVRESASKTLRDVRRRREGLMRKAQSKIDSLAKAFAFNLRDQPPTLRSGRFVLPVRTDRGGEVKGILLERSGTGGTMFIEPYDMVELNNDLVSIEDQEREALAALFRELAAACYQVRDVLDLSIEVLKRLDTLQCRWLLGKAWEGIIPKVSGKGNIRLVNARHPLLDDHLNPVRRGLDEPEVGDPCVPLNLVLDPERPVLVISGPNAGGKTVALKTLGLVVLIAQAGIPVPADKGTELPLLKQIFANIGDEQSIADSLSTFSARMVHLAHTLKEVEPPALVLLDELGSGTDPLEGGGIGGAALLTMAERGVYTVATTHHDGLKALALENPAMGNASVGFKEDTYLPDFTLTMDRIQSSMAFAIAERSGIPGGFLKTARKLAGEAQSRLAQLTQELDRSRLQLEEERRVLHQEKKNLLRLQDKTRLDRQKIKEKGQKTWERRLQGLDKLFDKEKKALLKEFKDLQDKEKARQSIDQMARRKAAEIKKEAGRRSATHQGSAPARKRSSPQRTLQVGDAVEVLSTGAKGTILAIEGNGKRVQVQLGAGQWSLPSKDMMLIEAGTSGKPSPKTVKRGGGTAVSSAGDPDLEINLIGQRVERALDVLDKSLDNALLAGQDWIRIVHGVGTGALRKAIRESLDRHPRVESWEEPAQNQGGAGATLARLSD